MNRRKFLQRLGLLAATPMVAKVVPEVIPGGFVQAEVRLETGRVIERHMIPISELRITPDLIASLTTTGDPNAKENLPLSEAQEPDTVPPTTE